MSGLLRKLCHIRRLEYFCQKMQKLTQTQALGSAHFF